MAEKTVKIDLRRSVGLPGGRIYGPGKGIEVPESLARAVQATAIGEAAADSEPTPDALEGVPFASPAAKAKAEEHGLVAASFARRRQGGEGGFTVDDVDRIASASG